MNSAINGAISTSDTITIELHDTLGMYMTIYSTIALLDTNGFCSFNVPLTLANKSFYIAIKHRNSIETWSANPVLIANGASYNFTNAANKAYGNNLKNDGGVYLIYCGDINQDGAVDCGDYEDLDWQSSTGFIGVYSLVYDLNGDQSVDHLDYDNLDINGTNGIFSTHP